MSGRQRRPHNELKNAARAYLATLGGGSASIAEIKEAIRPEIGTAPDSSYRSALDAVRARPHRRDRVDAPQPIP